MKKNLASLVALVGLVGLFMVSCNKEQLTGNGTQFRATMEQCAKTALDGTALNWVDGDQITVYGTAGSGLYSATPQTPATTALFDNVSGEPGDAPYRAYYPSTLTTNGTTVTLPATQTYVEGSMSGFPMYAESSDNQLTFKNLCGVLKLHLAKANTSISSIAVTAATEINGAFSVAYNEGDPELTYSANGTATTLLTCATAQSIAEGKDFYIYLPAGSYSGLQITMTASNGYVCTKTSNTAIVVERSAITTVTLGSTLDFRPVGSKGGLFTINANGDQVWFSQGNLQYIGSAATPYWKFADSQWERLGNNGQGSTSTTADRDLFGWGTSGWNSGANAYMPYSTSQTNSDYYPGGNANNDLAGTYAEADWALHNAISNGGNATQQWRTLTQAEWAYLFNTRANASSKWGHGKVNNINGMVILPDSWTMPAGLTFTSGNSNWSNVYTLAQWAEMEAAGAIFLPAAGYRIGTDVYDVNNYGIYWSSTHYDSNYAYSVRFYSGYLNAANNSRRYGGCAVRPVQVYTTD